MEKSVVFLETVLAHQTRIKLMMLISSPLAPNPHKPKIRIPSLYLLIRISVFSGSGTPFVLSIR